MNKIRILLIGKEDWKDKYFIPQNVELYFVDEITEDLGSFYDIVILDRDLSLRDRERVLKSARAYCLFVTENVKMNKNTQYIFDCKKGKYLYTKDVNNFLLNDAKNYYLLSTGEKINPEDLTVNQLFKGSIEFFGKYCLRLIGDYGEDYSQIVCWKENINLRAGQSIDLYLEHDLSDAVSIRLKAMLFEDDEVGELLNEWVFEGEALKEVFNLTNIHKSGKLFISIQAKGSGKIDIISLHNRVSRKDVGFFIPGGKRVTTIAGEEIFYYFDPGDRRSPLNVFFADYREREGFEGYYLFRELGTPTLLISDARLEGGGFYIGDAKYEESIRRIIAESMAELGFGSESVIMSGMGMGAYGAAYYGCSVRPHGIIMGKPIANLGSMTLYEKSIRPGRFPASLDLLLKNYGEFSDQTIKDMNNRLWDKFDRARWGETKFAIIFMYEDEYDPDAYEDFIAHLSRSDASVYGKGLHGRHDDNANEIYSWFKSQCKQMLSDFGRKNNLW